MTLPVYHIPKPAAGLSPVLPVDALCYLVGGDGLFKQVHNEFYSTRLKLDGIGGLAVIGEDLKLCVPKLPLELFQRAEGFFLKVYEQYKSEAVALLLANPASREWRLEIPEQNVRSLHVSYDLVKLPPPPPGFKLFGSIHSHADLKAFHSSTDNEDEGCFDGLHITIGNFDAPAHSYAARWIIMGRVFQAELAAVVSNPPLFEVDTAWLARVHKPKEMPEPADWANDWQGYRYAAQAAPRLALEAAALGPAASEAAAPKAALDEDKFGILSRQNFESSEEYREYLLELGTLVEDELSSLNEASLWEGTDDVRSR